MSTLRNVPVVFGQKQIGLFQDVCFDQARKRVYALVVACGMKGKLLVPSKYVRVLSENFILVEGTEKYRHAYKQNMQLFVRDTAGLLVGRVSDYAIDERSLDVLAIEMIPGYGPSERRKRIWIYAYSVAKDLEELSIPLDLRRQSSLFQEGNDACECPP